MAATLAEKAQSCIQESIRESTHRPLATFLGLFSLGLGLAEFVAPRTMSRLTGVSSRGLLRAYGLREIGAGVGILGSERTAFWLWNRVAGDTLDVATLGSAYAQAGHRDRQKLLISTAAVLGVTVLDVLCAIEHSSSHNGS